MLRTLLIFVLCLLSGCSFTYTSPARKAYLASCDTGINLGKLDGKPIDMTRAEIYSRVGKPVTIFETISPNTGETIIVEEYRRLDTYTEESDILKDPWGYPEKIEREACFYYYLVYAPAGDTVIGVSYQLDGRWTRDNNSKDWYTVRRRDGSLPDMYVY